MPSTHQSNILAKLISYGSFSITVLVFSGFGFDPVNLPKMFLLVIFSGALFGVWVYFGKNIAKSSNSNFFYLGCMFVTSLAISTIMGRVPWVMNFFGTYGRNTGFLTYFSLMIFSVSAMLLISSRQIKIILNSFFAALLTNIVYGVYLHVTKKDFFPWDNPYGNFLGTFGNPDFISAFLGMGVTVSTAYFIKSKNIYLKITNFILLPVEVILIKETHALQGIVVTLFGVGVILFFLIREKLSKTFQVAYLMLGAILSSLVILGMLQIGPLTKYFYKVTVSIRGEYWRAGFGMFKDSPIWGIGMDSYGDFYRLFREPGALVSPGVNVVTDVAHNVFLDILVGGGLLLIVPYLALIVLVIFRVFRFMNANRAYDPILVSLLAGWIAYLAQSVVSINQIGLAIWGWIFMGALYGYTNLSPENSQNDLKVEKRNKLTTPAALPAGNFVTTIASTMVFTLVILPAVLTEHTWRNTLKKPEIAKIVSATNSWPQNNQRNIQTANILLKANYQSDALNVLREGTKFDPNFRDYWYFIYNLTLSESEKVTAMSNLKRLDPLNKEQK